METILFIKRSHSNRDCNNGTRYSNEIEMNKNSNHPIGLQSDHCTNHARLLFIQRQDACSACKTPQGSTTTFKLLESFLMRGSQTNATSAGDSSYGVGEQPIPQGHTPAPRREALGENILQDNDWHFVLMLVVAPPGKWYLAQEPHMISIITKNYPGTTSLVAPPRASKQSANRYLAKCRSTHNTTPLLPPGARVWP
ncbi:hypothetical protein CEXT_34611 [Caerostris extrusa]|uniref:Uncharacterized protein n=1 Tax=Caerostris extrusa TaxID=172846 RepID=A0AAV4XEP1_CAEEX|nr:hypothetical protein CEXT_34611 [Caerostris extrusa]